MKTERKMVRNNVIYAGLFFIIALVFYIAFFHVFSRPFVQDLPVDVRTKIQNTKVQTSKDIEWLRSVALQLDENARGVNKQASSLIASAIDALIVFSILVAYLFLTNVGLWMKLQREQRNEIIPWWLRWL